jgi:hypothetical protein
VGEYIPTTSTINSAPRFDHNPTTGESLGLLVEEQRTNLLVRSEEFDNASWLLTNATVSANAIAAPNGASTADKFVETVDNGVHAIAQGTVSAGTAYVFSVYAKPGERTRMQLSGMGAEGQGFFTDYNLSTGVVSSAPSGSQMIAVGDGWYRCTLVITASATGGPIIRIRDASGSNTYTGDGTSGIYLWGAQLEAGAFATSYIPTTTATVTRSADVASISGSNYTGWANNNEGTIFVQSEAAPGSVGVLAEFRNANPADAPALFSRYFGNATRLEVPSNNDYTNRAVQLSYTPQSTNRYIGAYKDNDYAVTVNGLTPTGLTTATIGKNGNALVIGRNRLGGDVMNRPIRRLTFWPQRLPNSTLQSITQ